MRELKQIKTLINQMEGKDYDLILTFARGGLIPSQFIAYAKDIQVIHTYSQARAIGSSRVIQPTQKILVVDDICDSGATLTKAISLLRELKYGGIIDTAVMFKRYNSSFSPTYYGELIESDDYHLFTWDEEL